MAEVNMEGIRARVEAMKTTLHTGRDPQGDYESLSNDGGPGECSGLFGRERRTSFGQGTSYEEQEQPPLSLIERMKQSGEIHVGGTPLSASHSRTPQHDDPFGSSQEKVQDILQRARLRDNPASSPRPARHLRSDTTRSSIRNLPASERYGRATTTRNRLSTNDRYRNSESTASTWREGSEGRFSTTSTPAGQQGQSTLKKYLGGGSCETVSSPYGYQGSSQSLGEPTSGGSQTVEEVISQMRARLAAKKMVSSSSCVDNLSERSTPLYDGSQSLSVSTTSLGHDYGIGYGPSTSANPSDLLALYTNQEHVPSWPGDSISPREPLFDKDHGIACLDEKSMVNDETIGCTHELSQKLALIRSSVVDDRRKSLGETDQAAISLMAKTRKSLEEMRNRKEEKDSVKRGSANNTSQNHRSGSNSVEGNGHLNAGEEGVPKLVSEFRTSESLRHTARSESMSADASELPILQRLAQRQQLSMHANQGEESRTEGGRFPASVTKALSLDDRIAAVRLQLQTEHGIAGSNEPEQAQGHGPSEMSTVNMIAEARKRLEETKKRYQPKKEEHRNNSISTVEGDISDSLEGSNFQMPSICVVPAAVREFPIEGLGAITCQETSETTDNALPIHRIGEDNQQVANEGVDADALYVESSGASGQKVTSEDSDTKIVNVVKEFFEIPEGGNGVPDGVQENGELVTVVCANLVMADTETVPAKEIVTELSACTSESAVSTDFTESEQVEKHSTHGLIQTNQFIAGANNVLVRFASEQYVKTTEESIDLPVSADDAERRCNQETTSMESTVAEHSPEEEVGFNREMSHAKEHLFKNPDCVEQPENTKRVLIPEKPGDPGKTGKSGKTPNSESPSKPEHSDNPGKTEGTEHLTADLQSCIQSADVMKIRGINLTTCPLQMSFIETDNSVKVAETSKGHQNQKAKSSDSPCETSDSGLVTACNKPDIERVQSRVEEQRVTLHKSETIFLEMKENTERLYGQESTGRCAHESLDNLTNGTGRPGEQAVEEKDKQGKYLGSSNTKHHLARKKIVSQLLIRARSCSPASHNATEGKLKEGNEQIQHCEENIARRTSSLIQTTHSSEESDCTKKSDPCRAGNSALEKSCTEESLSHEIPVKAAKSSATDCSTGQIKLTEMLANFSSTSQETVLSTDLPSDSLMDLSTDLSTHFSTDFSTATDLSTDLLTDTLTFTSTGVDYPQRVCSSYKIPAKVIAVPQDVFLSSTTVFTVAETSETNIINDAAHDSKKGTACSSQSSMTIESLAELVCEAEAVASTESVPDKSEKMSNSENSYSQRMAESKNVYREEPSNDSYQLTSMQHSGDTSTLPITKTSPKCAIQDSEYPGESILFSDQSMHCGSPISISSNPTAAKSGLTSGPVPKCTPSQINGYGNDLHSQSIVTAHASTSCDQAPPPVLNSTNYTMSQDCGEISTTELTKTPSAGDDIAPEHSERNPKQTCRVDDLPPMKLNENDTTSGSHISEANLEGVTISKIIDDAIPPPSIVSSPFTRNTLKCDPFAEQASGSRCETHLTETSSTPAFIDQTTKCDLNKEDAPERVQADDQSPFLAEEDACGSTSSAVSSTSECNSLPKCVGILGTATPTEGTVSMCDQASGFTQGTNTLPETLQNDILPDDTLPDDTLPNNTLPDDTLPSDTLPDDTRPDNSLPDDTLPDTLSDNTLQKQNDNDSLSGVIEDISAFGSQVPKPTPQNFSLPAQATTRVLDSSDAALQTPTESTNRSATKHALHVEPALEKDLILIKQTGSVAAIATIAPLKTASATVAPDNSSESDSIPMIAEAPVESTPLRTDETTSDTCSSVQTPTCRKEILQTEPDEGSRSIIAGAATCAQSTEPTVDDESTEKKKGSSKQKQKKKKKKKKAQCATN